VESGACYRHRFFGLQSNPNELAELAKLIDAEHVKLIVTTVLLLSEAR
jgi:hypothetical protein